MPVRSLPSVSDDEVLELHNQQLFGRSLRDTLLERELAKLT